MPTPRCYMGLENLISTDFGEDPPPLHDVAKDTPMLRGVPFELNKNDELDTAHAALLNKLNAYCERAIHERKENHYYQGPLMHLKRESEENLIKLHALIGKYNRLPISERREEFFVALETAQKEQNEAFKQLLVPPFWDIKFAVDLYKAWPPRLFAYKVLIDFEFDEHRLSREILRPSQELAAIEAANAAVDASMAAAAAAAAEPTTESTTEVDEGTTVTPVVVANDQLRGKPNPYHPWVAPGPNEENETPKKAHKKISKKEEEEEEEESTGFLVRIAKAIYDFFSRMRARSATKKETRSETQSDEIELVDFRATTEADSVQEEGSFRVMSHAEITERLAAKEQGEIMEERRTLLGRSMEMPTEYRNMGLDVRPGCWRQPHPTDPTPDEDIDICRIGVMGLQAYLASREGPQGGGIGEPEGRGGRAGRGGRRGRGGRGSRASPIADHHGSLEDNVLAPVAEADSTESEASHCSR